MYTFNCKGRLLSWNEPIVMGVINVTPDSFYAGSRMPTTDSVLSSAEKMLNDGAAMLDIGGMSSRPDAVMISPEEELNRLVPAIAAVASRFPEAFIAVDSFRSAVVEEALAAGACIVNDISGGREPSMLELAGRERAPYICMHMRGTPQTMAKLNHYDDLMLELFDYFIQRTAECLRYGIQDFILDPGFGFAKNHIQNFQLLKQLSLLTALGVPVLAGLSRKSTIYKTLGVSADEALNGTTVLNTLALDHGASILRVHDVKEARETIRLWKSYASA
jgi:dihydropteroate synthase